MKGLHFSKNIDKKLKRAILDHLKKTSPDWAGKASTKDLLVEEKRLGDFLREAMGPHAYLLESYSNVQRELTRREG